MPLVALSEQPAHMTQEQYAELQQTTPSSFQGHEPVLRLRLERVRCLLQPATAWPGKEGAGQDAAVEGSLFVTESAVCFLPSDAEGFSLDYPSLSLHAISRSVPSQFTATTPVNESNAGCVYCQLSLSASEAEEEANEDEDEEVAELWILPEKQEDLESLFEALSHCASLHPSAVDDSGNPFASLGPFGTESNGTNGGDGGAYDDAEEVDGEDEAHLSETGRATLARLDRMLGGQEGISSQASPPASFHSLDPRRPADGEQEGRTCTLILVNLPAQLFDDPVLATALLDLLHAYGEMHSWTPLPSFGRAIIIYKEVEGARRAKEALDRLLLPLIDEDEVEVEAQQGMAGDDPKIEKQSSGNGLALRAYYGDTQALVRLQSDIGVDHLPVPSTDRNFLISPPGSPPVGWEPIREDPPNTNTLADDLIRALGSLRDRGLGVSAHTPTILDDKGTHQSSSRHVRTPSASTLMPPPPPSVIIPPSQAAVRSRHPLAQSAFNPGVEEGADGRISLPGVTVENVDSHEDAARAMDGLDSRLNKNLSISSVKATVESMRGTPSPGGLCDKITPTARPPLNA